MSLTDKQKHALARACDEIMALSPEAFRAELENQSDGDLAKVLHHSGMFAGCPGCEKLEADCAAMRAALIPFAKEYSSYHSRFMSRMDVDKFMPERKAVYDLLSSSTAGSALLEELRLLREVADKAEVCRQDPSLAGQNRLFSALDAWRGRKK